MAHTTRKRATHTIQLWPDGRSVEYYGDSADGEYNQAGGFTARRPGRRGLRFYDPNGGQRARFSRGTPADWREIRIARRAQHYQEQEIYHVDSSLVGDLIKLNGASCDGEIRDLRDAFEYDQIENLYVDPSDWDAEQCREYASDQGIDLPDDPEIECPGCHGASLTPPCVTCANRGALIDPNAAEDDSAHGWLTEAREACREHAQENPAEVYEWYRVSAWLCARLREIGEVVIDNGYGEWWGRCATGQALIMDGVLQRIARGQDQDQTEYDRATAKGGK